jgi:hypothetical protein
MTFSTAELQTYALWIAAFGGAMTVLTIVAWILKWGFRFRLVGVSSFTFVVAASVFALGLSFQQHESVPGSVRYTRIFDRQADQAVITVPATITESQLEATLRQAAVDLFSPGRVSQDGTLTVRARAVIHPQEGLSLPLYVGQVRRSLAVRDDANMEVEVYRENLAMLPQAMAS